jgi:phosphoribosylformylglycinamidine synthase
LDGAEVKDGETPVRWDALWFGEATGRVVFTVASIDAGKVMAQARILGIPAMLIGRTGGDQLSMKTSQGELSWGIAELKG